MAQGVSSRWKALTSSLVALCCVVPRGATAQLRPIESFDWMVFAPRVDVSASLGASYLDAQRISLAGETGALWELGRFHTTVRLDRVALEAYGTVVRRFLSDALTPAGEARRRQDAGAMHVATTVLMTPRTSRAGVALRFGVGIPTTDDRIGLDRDETDFFATLLSRAGLGPVTLTNSLGVGIFGSRKIGREQQDVWIYSAQVIRAVGRIRPLVEITGHVSTPGHLRVAGNEDLGELRAGFQAGHWRFAEVQLVRGLAEYSPRLGARVSVGFRR
jgi:hypothetical protein